MQLLARLQRISELPNRGSSGTGTGRAAWKDMERANLDRQGTVKVRKEVQAVWPLAQELVR